LLINTPPAEKRSVNLIETRTKFYKVSDAYVPMPLTVEEAENLWNIKLDKWQRELVGEILEGKTKHFCVNCGRKTGKTCAISFVITLLLLNEKFPVNCDGILALSYGHRQTKEILLNVRAFLSKAGFKFCRDRNSLGHQEEKVCYASTSEVIMPNGNRFMALPSGLSGDNLRPYSFAAIFFDEADFIQDDVYISTSACLAVYNGIEVLTSTPNPASGKDSYFYRAFYDTEYRRWTVPTKLCSRVSKVWLLNKKNSMSLSDYQREYECKFTEAVDGVFRNELLVAASLKAGEGVIWEQMFKYETYLGVDFARFGADDNVIAQAHLNSEKQQIYVKVTVIPGKGTRTTRICDSIKFLCDKYSTIRRVVTDEGGVGAGATDALMTLLGSYRVMGIMNQKRSEDDTGFSRKYIKVDLYTNLLRLMEYGMIKFDGDKRIISSLRGMKYAYGKNNVLNIHGRNSHIAEAIVRAVFPFMKRRLLTGTLTMPVFLPHKEALIIPGVNDEGWETLP
jgi:hypothetical protein